MGSNSEARMRGNSVSRGIAVGRAVCLYGRRRQFYRVEIPPSKIDKEIRRFRAAVRLAARQLGGLKKPDIRENAAGILDFHQTILGDPSLLTSVEEKIKSKFVNAEWAVKLVTDSYLVQYKSIADERFRERYVDLEDVTDRILTALGGGRRVDNDLDSGSVIIARELNPSTLIELAASDPRGIITEHGGWTSHTYILARELSIPAVTGVRSALRRIKSGDEVIVDGFTGDVIARPDPHTLKEFEQDGTSIAVPATTIDRSQLSTVDGRAIIIRANADITGRYERAKANGASGIGLFRSEYIFNRFRGMPDESEQFDAYHQIALSSGKDGVRIRTFDLGVGDISDQITFKANNPALGLRAIRISLDRETEFRVQLRALLRAAHKTSIDIILPMISDISEIRRSKQLLAEERESLLKNGVDLGEPRLGVMVEVPATVLMIDKILDEVDVLCLGTNDLVQYMLAVDRDNEAVAKWFNSLNPAVIRAIKSVLESAEDKRVSCVVCGEMAGSPFYVPLLIGLGATELSMNPTSIPRIRDLISLIRYEDTLLLAREVEDCNTAAEVEQVVDRHHTEKWSDLIGRRKTAG